MTTIDKDERISRIRERAYERWITYGGSDPIADWLEAEREIDAEDGKTEDAKAIATTDTKESEKAAAKTATGRG